MEHLRKIFVPLVGTGMLMMIGHEVVPETMTQNSQGICINEVCSANIRVIQDEAHQGDDFIELYNPSEKEVSLEGWYLSDDKEKPKKYQLPQLTISGKGYLLLYANGQEGGENLPFQLDCQGEMLFLSDENGRLADSAAIPKMETDVSYGRMQDGADTFVMQTPTPGVSNQEAEMVREIALLEPEFSAEGGFYDQEFFLELSAREGEEIYYTLDGSIPDENAEKYEEPLKIQCRSGAESQWSSQQRVVKDWEDYEPEEGIQDQAVVVRAIAMNAAGQKSPVVTHTYFVQMEEYQQQSVLSLVIDPEDLYGEQGIFVTGEAYDTWYQQGKQGVEPEPNFMKRGIAWEVLGNIELYEAGDRLLEQAVGIRTQGNSGRLQAKKRLSLFSRKEYSGSDFFDGCLLDKENVHGVMINEYKSNVILPKLLEDRSVGIQASKLEPVAVFLNGEYWYTRYIMEKYNSSYLFQTYGVSQDNVVIFKNNEVHTGDGDYEKEIRRIQKIAGSKGISPEQKYDLLAELIDIQSFTDFMAANIYLCNMNLNEKENYVLWRTCQKEEGAYGDTRWRWLIYDMECIESLNLDFYTADSPAVINSFVHPMEWTMSVMNENSIYAGLKESERFRKQFVLSFMDMANVNFSAENVLPVLSAYGEDLSWMNDFFSRRFTHMVRALQEEFSLEGTLEYVTIGVSQTKGGRILLNTTAPDLSQGQWSGMYFTDFPITVTAVPEEGYVFRGWTGDVALKDASIEVEIPKGGLALQAIFEKE